MTLLFRIAGVAWPFLKAVFNRYFQHEGGVIAGYMAFAAMLAIVPFLLFATALTGYVIGVEGSETAVQALFNALPPTVALTLEPVLLEIVNERRGGLITLSAVGALYAASNGAEAVRVALDRAYEADIPRNFLQHYLFSFMMVVLGFIVFIVLAGFIILAPLAYYLLQREAQFDLPFGANAVRYAISITVFCAFLWVVHRVLPSRRMRGFRIWPGILTTVVIWVGSATAFSYYLSNVGSYTITYGTLAGVIVTLVFFYIAGTAIIFGGEVNAVVNAGRLVTVIADDEVLDAVDAADRAAAPEEEHERVAAGTTREERLAATERSEAERRSGQPVTAAGELDAARSPAERAEARAARHGEGSG